MNRFTDTWARHALSRAVHCCLLTLLLPAALFAQSNDVPDVTRTFAIENTRVVQAPGTVIENATVIVRDGLITEVGSNVRIPFDAERIAGDSLTVYAGFIDGLTHAGIPTPKPDENASQGRGNQPRVNRANPPNARAGIQPEQAAADLLKADEKSIKDLREAGFTVAHIAPRGQMLPGTSALILLNGDDANQMVLQRDVSMFAQLKGARGVYPGTPMGVMAKLRQLYREAARRKQMETLYASDAAGMPRPEYDAVHYAFFPVLDGNMPVFMHTSSALDIYRAIRLKNTLGFPLVLSGLYGGFEAVDQLLEADVPLFLSLKLPKDLKKDKADDKAAEGEEAPAYDPTLHVTNHMDTEQERINLETRRKIFHKEYLATASTLFEAGLNFGFSTMDIKAGDVHGNIRKMIEHGLSEDVALAALTTQPATILGLSQSMGTVEPGKMANLVLTTGPLFDEKSKIKYVFVDGSKFEYDVKEKKKPADGAEPANPTGTWSFVIEEAGMQGTMVIEGTPGDYSGTLDAGDQLSSALNNIEIIGSEISFDFDAGQFGSVTAVLTIDEDDLEGTFTVPQMGDTPVTGTRTSGPDDNLF